MTTTEKQIKGVRKPTEVVEHPGTELTIRYKPEIVQFHQVEITFPDKDEWEGGVVIADLFITGTDRSWRVDHITLMDGHSWPIGWTEGHGEHLKNCCNAFCNGVFSDSVLTIELDDGTKIERSDSYEI